MNIINSGSNSKATIIKSSYEIKPMDVDNIVQNRVLPRQVSTGITRGTQTIKGKQTIVDDSGTTLIVMGFDEGKF